MYIQDHWMKCFIMLIECADECCRMELFADPSFNRIPWLKTFQADRLPATSPAIYNQMIFLASSHVKNLSVSIPFLLSVLCNICLFILVYIIHFLFYNSTNEFAFYIHVMLCHALTKSHHNNLNRERHWPSLPAGLFDLCQCLTFTVTPNIIFKMSMRTIAVHYSSPI